MTDKEAIKLLKVEQEEDEFESAHSTADKILCEVRKNQEKRKITC